MELDGNTLCIYTGDPLRIQPLIDGLRSRGQVIFAVQRLTQSLEDFFIQTVTDSPFQGGPPMTQTWAIFLEAYRNLNSKKLFWLVLILSGLVVASFACVGINPQGLKLLFWQVDSEMLNSKQIPVDQFYKGMFVDIGIGVWLSWFAAILALVSTAGIFPDLMTSGSIDLFVSKPIGRLRLFFTEYLAGLLFAALQVTVFTVACFLVIGLRGGVWEPGLFLAIPIVVCFFSYLFSVSVFLGVATRSTVAALLLTLLFWFGVWVVGRAEVTLLMFKTMQQHGAGFAAQVEENRNMQNAHRTPSRIESSPPADQHLATKAKENSGTAKAEAKVVKNPDRPKTWPPADQHLATKAKENGGTAKDQAKAVRNPRAQRHRRQPISTWRQKRRKTTPR